MEEVTAKPLGYCRNLLKSRAPYTPRDDGPQADGPKLLPKGKWLAAAWYMLHIYLYL